VRAGDKFHDREAEARPPAAARLVGATEAVEGAVAEVGRKARAFVADVKLDVIASLLCPKRDRTGAVRESVVHEVHERLADAERVGLGVEIGVDHSNLPPD
jgi:hypothetical protein